MRAPIRRAQPVLIGAAALVRDRQSLSPEGPERMCGRPLESKGFFERIWRRDACSHVYDLFVRVCCPLVLMNSADRLPISGTRCNAAFALRVLPLPGVRPVRHHLPSMPRLRRTAAPGTPDLRPQPRRDEPRLPPSRAASSILRAPIRRATARPDRCGSHLARSTSVVTRRGGANAEHPAEPG